jgi:Domain of unknown function (DUF4386)
MDDTRFASRWLAALLLVQLVVGPIANFTLVGDTFDGPGGFLVNAAQHAEAIGLAALLSLGLAVASAAIAVVLWPVVRPRSERLALWLAILAAAGIALAGLENAQLMSLVTLSQAYAAAAPPDEALYQALRGVVGSYRNWAHVIQLLAMGALLLATYGALYRLRLVPALLAGFGMLAASSQMIAVAKPLFGGWVVFPMLLPLGLANLALVVWLLWKGFRPGRTA